MSGGLITLTVNVEIFRLLLDRHQLMTHQFLNYFKHTYQVGYWPIVLDVSVIYVLIQCHLIHVLSASLRQFHNMHSHRQSQKA